MSVELIVVGWLICQEFTRSELEEISIYRQRDEIDFGCKRNNSIELAITKTISLFCFQSVSFPSNVLVSSVFGGLRCLCHFRI